MTSTSENDNRPVSLCLDLEAGSHQLAKYAADFATSYRLPVHVLHVLQSRLDETDQERSRRQLAAICQEILPRIPAQPLHVAEGLPEDCIVTKAGEIRTGMILRGHRKRITVDRIYVGSTTSTVIPLASRPVLVVPIAVDND